MIRKNLGIYFQERLLEVLTKINDILWNFWEILKKFTENFTKQFKLWGIFENQFDIKTFNHF